MNKNLLPVSKMPNLISRWPSWDLEIDDWFDLPDNKGLSVYEDEKNIIVEADVPGINPEQLQVTYDRGVLWIRGEAQNQEEDKNRKYYRRASSSYSYRLSVPGKVNTNQEPEVSWKNGKVKAVFSRQAEEEPKQLKIKTEK